MRTFPPSHQIEGQESEVKHEILHILQHALGVDQYGRGIQYRNHFVTGPGSKDWDLCNEAVSEGMMLRNEPREIYGNDYNFQVTQFGRQFMASKSLQPPRLTRSQLRYRRFCEIDGGFTFKEWIQNGWYKQF